MKSLFDLVMGARHYHFVVIVSFKNWKCLGVACIYGAGKNFIMNLFTLFLVKGRTKSRTLPLFLTIYSRLTVRYGVKMKGRWW